MSQNNNGRNKALLGLAGVIGIALLKFQGLALGALKALSLFKISWLFSSFGSMFVTLWLYIIAFGWKFAIAIMVLLYIHEMGHYIFASAMGLKPRLPKFAFFVAWVSHNPAPDQVSTAWLSIAGPLVGAVGSAVFYWTGVHLDNRWLMAAGSTGFLLNLMQLIPAKPLDGGHVIGAVSKWLLVPGVILVFYLAWRLPSAMFLIIGVISLFSLIKDFRGNSLKEQAKPTSVVRTPTGTVVTVRDLERAMQSQQSQQSQQSPQAPSLAESEQTSRTETLLAAGNLDTKTSANAQSDTSQPDGQSAPKQEPGKVQELSLPERTPATPATPATPSTPSIPATFWQRVTIGIAYVTLVGILGYLYAVTGVDMKELSR